MNSYLSFDTWEPLFLFKPHAEGSRQDNPPDLDLGRGGVLEGLCLVPSGKLAFLLSFQKGELQPAHLAPGPGVPAWLLPDCRLRGLHLLVSSSLLQLSVPLPTSKQLGK